MRMRNKAMHRALINIKVAQHLHEKFPTISHDLLDALRLALLNYEFVRVTIMSESN